MENRRPALVTEHDPNPSCATPVATGAAPSTRFQEWYVKRFDKYLAEIRASTPLTTYFAMSFGELYEYTTEFIRVVHLIKDTADPKSIRSSVILMGWKWYRLASDKDWNVRTDDDGKWKPIANDRLNAFARAKGLSTASSSLVAITTGQRGALEQVAADHGFPLPCYLFLMRPRDLGPDFWTAQHFLEAIGEKQGEDAIYAMFHLLHDASSRLKSLLRDIKQTLEKPSLLHTDVDRRRKTRAIPLGSVNKHFPALSPSVAAASAFYKSFLEVSARV
jgi:hypothetical protein